MKSIKLIALVLFMGGVSIAQKPAAPYKVYKIINYQMVGTRTTYDTIKASAVFDIISFNRHFDYPALPPALKDPRYKSHIVKIRANGEVIKEGDTVKDSMHKPNIISTYQYDNLSRVINFSGSGCMVCNFAPSSHNITYNKQGLVETVIKTEMGRDTCKFQYDTQGNITRFDYYNGTGLRKSIIKQ